MRCAPRAWRLGAVARSLVVLCIPLQCGCAIVGDAAYSAAFRIKTEDASGLSSADLRRLGRVPVHSSGTALAYVPVAQVSGLACKLSVAPLIPVWLWRPPVSELNGSTPEQVAMTQLKVRALRSGGNAILSPVCVHNEGLDWQNNCFESWICKGEAIRLEHVLE
jgi:hypothetical protein